MLATQPKIDTIAITRSFDGIEAATHRVITQAGGMASVIKDAKVAVRKPNFVAGRSAETGSTTSFALLKAVAEEVHACGAEPVLYETPGTEFDREATYTILGVEKFCADHGIRIVRIDPEGGEQDWIELRPAGAKRLRRFRIPRFMQEACFINLPVLNTRLLLKACQGQSRLRRMVHVSTTGVHGVTGETPAAEDAPFAPTNPYEATKLEGELLALKAYQEQGLPVTVIRPGLVYGPGDLHLLGFFVSIKKGLFRVIAGGKALLHPVYIDDLIAALLLCAKLPQAPGRSYNIAGERPVTIRELATAIVHALDRELPAGSIPLWLANLASDIFAVMPGMKGERAPLTRSRVKFLTHSRIYDSSRAKSELGYAPRVELEEGMKLTAAWYYKHHYLDD